MAKQPSKKKRQPYLVCDKCGAHNPVGAEACSACGGKRFAPEWVKEMRQVTRNFRVQVTEPSPQFSDSSNPRITLYKWWPGNRTSLNINTPAHWEAVKHIVDNELGPILGWKSKRAVAKELREIEQAEAGAEQSVSGLLAQHPQLITRIVTAIDPAEISEEDVPALSSALAEMASLFTTVDEKHRVAISELVKKLPKQRARAIDQLSELMESLTLGQIVAVTTEVSRRIGLLQTFSERAQDDTTYEIMGDGSIHRLLEQAMWIVDERYWLMHSNRQLRTVVGKEMAKRHKKFEKKRPDFVCGTVDNKLIIIELKRPSHDLKPVDLNQLEQYVIICREYDDTIKSFEAILVGKKKSKELDAVLRVRGGNWKVRTYTQLISDAERRYKNYLDQLEKTD